ncbi:MAG: M48 family metalloprotease [Defluviitaleaceae bacterium]|nr:M48 family metalloprotease [Defluviitaleaceae bacterium]
MKKFFKDFKGNEAYLVWFLFYVIFFSVLTSGIALLFYLITVPLALSQSAEKLWRMVNGVRPLRMKAEKERLMPLFKEVYDGALDTDPSLSQNIRLYIKEDMTINAFAFGKTTLVITRGALHLLNDESLKGLIAHEFGHFKHKHTEAILVSMVGNLPMAFIIRKLTDLKNHYDNSEKKDSIIMGAFRGLCDLIYYLFKGIDFIGDLILMNSSRKNEYVADRFAIKSGFGQELTDVLIEIYEVSVSKPQSVKEQLKSTHPHITLRIERLESTI